MCLNCNILVSFLTNVDLILLTFSEKDTMEVWVNGVVVETAVSKIIIIHVHLTDDVLVSS